MMQPPFGGLLERELAGGRIDEVRDQGRDGLGHGDLEREAVDARCRGRPCAAISPAAAPAAFTTRPARDGAARGGDAVGAARLRVDRGHAWCRGRSRRPARSAAAAMAGVARSGLALPSHRAEAAADGGVRAGRARRARRSSRPRITISTPSAALDPRLGRDAAASARRSWRPRGRPRASRRDRRPRAAPRPCHSSSDSRQQRAALGAKARAQPSP